MVRLNRIYTRTGDDGTTGLVGGERVPKDDPRIEAYGTVDELNACIGLCREANRQTQDEAARSHLDAELARIQQQLFNLGSSLATRMETRFPNQPVILAADVTGLEASLDALNEALEPLRSFVLPGGGPTGAALHLARTVCRRAERRAFELSHVEAVSAEDLQYLNRLSDWLFVASRWIAKKTGEPESLWTP
jgi:cob(I)alamin adenosyltransferase